MKTDFLKVQAEPRRGARGSPVACLPCSSSHLTPALPFLPSYTAFQPLSGNGAAPSLSDEPSLQLSASLSLLAGGIPDLRSRIIELLPVCSVVLQVT